MTTAAPGRATILFGPEGIAAILSVVALAAAGLFLLGTGGGTGTPPANRPAGVAGSTAQPRPSATPATNPATPTLGPDWAAARDWLALHAQTTEFPRLLERELEAGSNVDTAAIAGILRDVNWTITAARPLTDAMGTNPATRDIGTKLATAYDELRSVSTATLRAPLARDATYMAGARDVIAQLGIIDDLATDLRARMTAAEGSTP
jgi:hypothetical protein